MDRPVLIGDEVSVFSVVSVNSTDTHYHTDTCLKTRRKKFLTINSFDFSYQYRYLYIFKIEKRIENLIFSSKVIWFSNKVLASGKIRPQYWYQWRNTDPSFLVLLIGLYGVYNLNQVV